MMSLWEDYKAEAQFEWDFPFGVPNGVWRSRAGDIKLCDMTERHIRNCMRIVGEDDAWYREFVEELERRGVNDGNL